MGEPVWETWRERKREGETHGWGVEWGSDGAAGGGGMRAQVGAAMGWASGWELLFYFFVFYLLGIIYIRLNVYYPGWVKKNNGLGFY